MKTRHDGLCILLAMAFVLSLVGASGLLGTPAQAKTPSTESALAVRNSEPVGVRLNGSPILFVENVGQLAPEARFQALGANATLVLAEDGLWLTLRERPNVNPMREGWRPDASRPSGTRKGVHLHFTFPGANPHPTIEPLDPLETHVSYLRGSDPARWRPDVPIWGGVRYLGLYPGVDLEVTSEAGQLALTAVAASGYDLGAVRLRVNGAESLSADGGRLRAATVVGEVALPLLTARDAAGKRLAPPEGGPRVEASQVSLPFSTPVEKRSLSSSTASSHLLFATGFGGSAGEGGEDLARDAAGAVYLTGLTYSADFPVTPGAFDTVHGGFEDVIVAKFSPDGSHLDYATFLGGADSDFGNGIAVDNAGNAYVTGNTRSSDFPTTAGAFNTVFNGGYYGDAFVTKLNPTGSALVYATFLGGSEADYGEGIALDGSGNAYLAGYTYSSDFPTTPGVVDANFAGDTEAFVAKLSPAGTYLEYATLLGGGAADFGTDIVVDDHGNAFIVGFPSSDGFATTPGAFDTSPNGNGDLFVVKLSPGASTFEYATLLGGSGSEYGAGIAVDGTGAALVTGRTESTDFPVTAGAFDTSANGSTDVFVAKLNASGSALDYATLLGGSSYEFDGDIAVDAEDNAYVTGTTNSSDFPSMPCAYDTTFSGGDTDAFVAKLSASGSRLLYSTFLGGQSREGASAIAVDKIGNAYVTGFTWSSDFPATPGSYDTTYENDGFLAKLAVSRPLYVCFSAVPLSGLAPLSVTFTNQSTGIYTSALWDFGDGNTSTLQNPTHRYGLAGKYNVTLSADGPGGRDTLVRADYIQVSTRVHLPMVASSFAAPLFDDFSNPASAWPVSEDAISSSGYLDGEYRILVKEPYYIVRAGRDLLATDFHAEVDARAAEHTNGAIGFYFGSSEAGYYVYQVHPGYGMVTLRRYDANAGSWTTLINPFFHPAVRTGNQSNHLAVDRARATITLYANGEQVAQTSSDAFGEGYVGLAASGYAANFDARFDNFALVFSSANRSPMANSTPALSASGDAWGPADNASAQEAPVW